MLARGRGRGGAAERELAEVTESTSWRITEPLRRLNAAAQGAPGAMIAFGCPITVPEIYERFAKPGIDAVAEPGAPVFAYRATSSIFRSYNLILDQAADVDDLEALVLVHQDTELVDPALLRHGP